MSAIQFINNYSLFQSMFHIFSVISIFPHQGGRLQTHPSVSSALNLHSGESLKIVLQLLSAF
jgi:hypothetical protein